MNVDGGSSRGFEAAAERLRTVTFRDDLAVRQIPSPAGLAPDSIAFAADVRPDSHGDSPFGTGRFILLHDPDEPDAWDGAWRIVTFAQAPLEPEIGTDPLLADVAWSWLTDALAERGASSRALAGTATKTVSRGFGSLAFPGRRRADRAARVVVARYALERPHRGLGRARLYAGRPAARVRGHRGAPPRRTSGVTISARMEPASSPREGAPSFRTA